MLSLTINDYKILRDNQCSLQETSKDTSEMDSKGSDKVRYLTFCKKHVVDFDKVKTAFMKSLGIPENMIEVKSVDALVLEDKFFFIEFKNGNARKEKTDVLIKAKDSMTILNSILKLQVEDARKNYVFILVYNKDEVVYTDKEKIAKTHARKGKEPYVLFELGRMKGFNFKEVYTLNQDEFQEQIIEELGWG